MEMFLNIVPVLGIAALLFAALLAARVSKQKRRNRQDEGDCDYNRRRRPGRS